MNEKFMFSMSLMATGPLYIQSEYANQNVKQVDFDPKKALELLKDDGWSDSDGDQILDKTINGSKTKLSFTILEPSQDFVKFLTVFKEDAKKAGVEINIKYIEWNSFLKLVDERKFEAIRLAWGGGSLDWDPKQIWHSSSIGNEGSNFIGYSNPDVDKMIDQAREEMDKKKRIKLMQKIYKDIADDVPYIFFFNPKYALYGHTEKMKRVKDTYKFGIGLNYWWISK
jgi:peptide/nickel transport system substrate-binding protein/microcin C transport system substrate-binding protein